MPNFSNSTEWSLILEKQVLATRINEKKFIPIAPITFNGISLSFRYLRSTVIKQNAKVNWRLGAWIEFLVDEPNPKVEVLRILSRCNKSTLIKTPEYLDTYQIQAIVPYWFNEISLKVEGYTGTVLMPDSSNDLSILVL